MFGKLWDLEDNDSGRISDMEVRVREINEGFIKREESAGIIRQTITGNMLANEVN